MGLKRISVWMILGLFVAGAVVFLSKGTSTSTLEVAATAPTEKDSKPVTPNQNIPNFAQKAAVMRAPSALLTSHAVASVQPTRQSLYNPNPKLSHATKSNRLAEFATFENLYRKEITGKLPELSGWSLLPELSIGDDSLGAGEKALTFKGLHFKSGGSNNLSTLQQFRGPIAVISPDTKKVAIVTGRISVLHKGNVDRVQFALDHNLKLEAAPENSKSASYTTEIDHSLIDARNLISRDSRVEQAEIELLSEGVKK